MLKALKVSVVLVAVLFVALQFVARPRRTNPALDEGRAIGAHLRLTPEVEAVLQRSCMDCHSNKTEWPLYSYVAPMSWLVVEHVDDGRKNLNFSDWSRYDGERARHLLYDICQTAKQGTMPLGSYTFIHRDAKLSTADVSALCDWSNAERQRLAALAQLRRSAGE